MRKRRRFPPEFQAKVVLEVLTGAQTPAEACRKLTLSPNLPGLWKTAFLERAHTLFQPDEQRDEDQAGIAELEQFGRRSRRSLPGGRGRRSPRRLAPGRGRSLGRSRSRPRVTTATFPASLIESPFRTRCPT
jgi:transposase-like protein